MEFPLAIDFQFLESFMYTDKDTILSIATRLKLLMMPWLYFSGDMQISNNVVEYDEIKKLMENTYFINHLRSYYKKASLTQAFVND